MSEKYHREIEEILARMDLPPRQSPPPRRPGGGGSNAVVRFLHRVWGPGWDVSPERLLLAALVLAVVAGLGTTVVRLPLMHYVALFSVALFVTALILSMTGWHRPRHEQRWRGQLIDLSQARHRERIDWSFLWRRFTRWLRGR